MEARRSMKLALTLLLLVAPGSVGTATAQAPGTTTADTGDDTDGSDPEGTGAEPPPPATPAPQPATPFGNAPPAGLSAGERMAWEAGLLVDQGQFAGAEAKAMLAQTTPGGEAAGAYQMGRIRLRQGRIDEALATARQGLAKAPSHFGCRLLEARTLALLGRAEQILSQLTSLTKKYPDDLGYQLALAEAQIGARRNQEAMATARGVLKRAETSVAAMKLLARAYMASGNEATAESILARVLELGPDAEAFNLRAQVELDRKAVVKARTWLDQAVAMDPYYVEALNNLGFVYLEVRNFEAAGVQLDKATRLAPGFSDAWLNLGSAHRGQGRFEQAELAWKKTLEVDKGYSDAWYNLGVLYLENPLPGREREAQLGLAVTAFNNYKQGAHAMPGGQDPNVDKFLGEAKLLIDQEKQRKLEELKQPDEGTDGMGDDGMGDDGMGDDGTGDDGMGDDGAADDGMGGEG